MDESLLVRGGRIVPLDDGAVEQVADIRIRDGVVIEVGPDLTSNGEPELDATDAWVLPGLWDAHIHFTQYVRAYSWVDVAGSQGPEDVCRLMAAAVAERPADGTAVIGFGYRSGPWERVGTVAELDAVATDRPLVVIAGDAHNGWLNSTALAAYGLPPREGPLVENDWFGVFGRLDDLPGASPTAAQEDAVAARLASRGLTGVVDLEFEAPFRTWPARVARGLRSLRVRTGVYPHQVDDVLAAGWRTGDALPGGDGLVTMGPLKIITDGSMGTRTAWCCAPYCDASPDDEQPAGYANLTTGALHTLFARAHGAGLAVAAHAIGDRANGAVLDAFAATGASGSVEHAQLLQRADVARFAALDVVASMQPHHLVADRDPAAVLWADRTDRLYLARSILSSGGRLALGSDAPVSPPDPWLAIATAVHRSGDERPGWHPEESLTPQQALAASVDEQRVTVGGRGDLVVVGADPLWLGEAPDATAAHLRAMPVRATVCAGLVTHRSS